MLYHYFAIIICSCVACTSCFADTLLDAFKDAHAGDFVVYEYQKQITLLLIKEKNEKEVVFEEISAPQAIVDSYKSKWKTWVQEGAPSHTSWTIATMTLPAGAITSIYSFDTRTLITQDQAFSFLPILLQRPLHEVEPYQRKYVGPPPEPGEQDFRKLWYPKIVYEGELIHPGIQARRIFWPQDGSDLSGKTIDLYLAEKPAITYFPYWIETSLGIKKMKLYVIDSGHNLIVHEQKEEVMNKSDSALTR